MTIFIRPKGVLSCAAAGLGLVFVALGLVLLASRASHIDEGKPIAPRQFAEQRRLLSNSEREQGRHPLTTKMQCGILYFYHIGKTGGMSLQKYFARESSKGTFNYSQLDIHDPMGTAQLSQLVDEEADWAIRERRTLVLHVHHRKPSMVCMRQKLPEVRRRLAAHGCGMVVVVTVREPVSLVLSTAFYIKLTSNLPSVDVTEAQWSNLVLKYLLVNLPVRNFPEQSCPELDALMQTMDLTPGEVHDVSQPMFEAAQQAVRDAVDVVCDLSDREACIHIISTLLGSPAVVDKKNINPDRAGNSASLSPEELATVTRNQAQAQRFYDWILQQPQNAALISQPAPTAKAA